MSDLAKQLNDALKNDDVKTFCSLLGFRGKASWRAVVQALRWQGLEMKLERKDTRNGER